MPDTALMNYGFMANEVITTKEALTAIEDLLERAGTPDDDPLKSVGHSEVTVPDIPSDL